MGAIPTLGHAAERLVQIPGTMPRLDAIPQGCAFHPRCAHAFDRCRIERPERDAGRSLRGRVLAGRATNAAANGRTPA